MATIDSVEGLDLMERTRAAIASQGPSDPMLFDFTRAFFANLPASELQGFTADMVAELSRQAFSFALVRAPGRHVCRLYDLASLAGQPLPHGPVTVLEVLNDDMPFLVDTVIGEIIERGLEPRFVAHPILRLSRNADQRIERIYFDAASDGQPRTSESLIHVHLPRLSDAAERASLIASLDELLDTLRTVVRDWRAMVSRLDRAISDYSSSPPPLPVGDLEESVQFLRWLADNNFTFLGMREYAYQGDALEGDLVPVQQTGLGVLRDPTVYVLKRGEELVHMTPEIRQFYLAPEPLIITKANVRSKIHRRAHMDYIGIKIYLPTGEICGELRIVGLFTSTAYTRSVRSIPLLRQKVDQTQRKLGYFANSHSGRALLNTLETFPRDELFQIAVDDLARTSQGILGLTLKPRTRLFLRLDKFDRFASILVYVPRERFTTEVRKAIGAYLASMFAGRVSAFYPFFPDGPLVRIHFIIGRNEGSTARPAEADLEAGVMRIVQTWDDRLKEAIGDVFGAEIADDSQVRGLVSRYVGVFSAGYSETFTPARAIEDIRRFEILTAESPIAIDLYRDTDVPSRARVAIYHQNGPIPLSQRVPILENLGFSVIDERSFSLANGDPAAARVLHDMVIETKDGSSLDVPAHEIRIEEAFLAVWAGRAANDGFNQLVFKASFDWRDAACLRAYSAYMRQMRSPFGQVYIGETLVKHSAVAAQLMALFHARFDPKAEMVLANRQAKAAAIAAEIEAALAAIPSLDEDRILRQLLNLIQVTLRTNFYQPDANGAPRETLSFKLDSRAIAGLPEPRPYREIFVSGPRVDGVHLRFGPIARGGLRWSDRLQDFRTEVLGLVKAQQVKNTVIVPNGSKGGFVPKHLPAGGSRDAIMAEGIAAYKLFVGSLIELTDNIVAGQIVPPAHIIRHDGDDPYLVVAADKGTATFSDIANGLSTERGFWLGDAFASGGSAGYDHKKMAITARGAWEAVKRHFREMDINIQTTPFRVTGIGDMSGDVFGNGMLLSEYIKLVAAFDHRDIFIDPEPDCAVSFAERARLFALPRSSWQDYDPAKISAGGGVFSRSAKAIPVSPQMAALLGLTAATVTPSELMRAILKAPVDLCWFGGIGTYVRSPSETDADVGDRANDAIRVTSDELGAKVIGEGANLGMTQAGRIAFAKRGGRLNTDAIDNSAGVNSSDQEVNIKIGLGAAIANGTLDLPTRNEILVAMTEDVAASVLTNNYRQTLALSLGQRRGLVDLGFQQRLMRELEAEGRLNRALEALPSDAEIAQRATMGVPLTRPELAVLLAYAKIDLTNDLIDSAVPDDPYLATMLVAYFPALMRERFAAEIAGHQLRREIIATQLCNDIINRGGSTMIIRLREETGHSPADIAYAFIMAKEVFGLDAIYADIDALDNRVSGATQLALYTRVQDLLRLETAWFLRHSEPGLGLSDQITRFKGALDELSCKLDACATPRQRTRMGASLVEWTAQGVPDATAHRLIALETMADAPDIALVARATGRPMLDIAAVFGGTSDRFRLDELRRAAGALPVASYFDRLAVNATLEQLSGAQRAIARDVVRMSGDGALDFAAWAEGHGPAIGRTERSITEIIDGGEASLSKLTVAVSQLRDLVAG